MNLQARLRPLFWALALFALAIVSMVSDSEGPSFWIAFFAIIAVAVSDTKRCTRCAKGAC